MPEPSEPKPRPPRRWLHWLRRLTFLAVVVAALIAAVLIYLYYNLTDVVVWFANRVHPELVAELKHAAFVSLHRIEAKNLTLKLRNHSEQVLGIEMAGIDFHWRDLWKHRIGSIQVSNPQIFIDDRLLGLPLSTQTSTPPDAKSTPIVSPEGLWLVDEFKVIGGKGNIDLANSPVIHFDFDSTLHAIYLSPEVKFSKQSQTATISNVEFLSRAEKPVRFGKIKSITAQFSLLGIAANRIDDIAIQTPSLWLNPGLIAAFAEPATPAAPAPPAAAPTPPPQTPVASWVIGKIHLPDGQFFMSDFDATVPETSFKFAVDEQDLQIGAASGDLLEKPHKMQIWDIRTAAAFARFAPFLYVGSVQIDFTAGGTFARRELGTVTVSQLDFEMGKIFRSLLATIDQKSPSASAQAQPQAPPPATTDASVPWKIRTFRLINARATLADLGVELPNIAFKLDTELHDVALSGDIREASTQVQTVEITDLVIRSPQDPFVPVLNFSTIRLSFSLAQILDQEIDSVDFDNPTIFVGEGLFWYADEWKRRQAAVPPAPAVPVPAPVATTAPAQPGWRINQLSVERGELVIASNNQADVEMPFYFSTEAEDLHFNKLSDLQFKLNLKVPQNDYTFPSYQLAFKQLEGKLNFGLPPGTEAKNVVQKFDAAGLKWKQFAADKVWFAVTYDVDGIYGRFGGKAYDGYVTGAFTFYMSQNSPWVGWVSGSKVDLKKVTDILAPQNFQMSGPADFSLEVNGTNHEIERVAGKFKTTSPGRLKISKFDQLIANLPKTWTTLKQGTTRIALETLRDFDYTTGDGNFWFAGDKGNLILKMGGRDGSRNFDVTLHGD